MLITSAWLMVAALAGGGGFVAGRATFTPPAVEAELKPAASYTVAEGEVGRSTEFPLGVRWPSREVGFAATEGTVTEVLLDPTEVVSAGAVLYTVDLRPVVVALGQIPAFRDLAEGDSGTDVRQLQDFLIAEGYLRAQADGKFGAATTAGVKAWQRAVGVERTGSVGASDLVYVPELPARVSLTDKVAVGSRLLAGDPTVTVITGAPELTITVSSSAVLPASGTSVSVTYGEHKWLGRIGSALESEAAGETALLLESIAEGPLCGVDCGALPLGAKPDGGRVAVQIVPAATGPVVPVAALGQDPTGGTTVTALDGTAIPVTVLATDGSRVVVDGVAPGTVIRVFADDNSLGSDS